MGVVPSGARCSEWSVASREILIGEALGPSRLRACIKFGKLLPQEPLQLWYLGGIHGDQFDLRSRERCRN